MMKRGRKKKDRKIRRIWIDSLLITVLVIIVSLVIALLISVVKAGKEAQNFRELAEQVKLNAEPIEEYIPEETGENEDTEEEEAVMLDKYAVLFGQNPDLFGWINIEGTVLNYPVMYTPEEPDKYLNLDFYGQNSKSGVPFLEDTCTPESDNLIIYGHNMKNGTMFHELFRYEKKDYWEEHPVIRFDSLYKEQEYEVLAAFYDRVYYKHENVFKFYKFTDAQNKEEFDNAVWNFRNKALYDTGVTANYGDQLITLVTCAYHVENGRFVVVARKCEDREISLAE